MPRDVRSVDLGISTRLSMSSRPNGVTKEMTSTTSGIAPSMSSTLSSPNSQLAISPAKGGISAGNSLQSTGTIGEKHTGSIQPNAPGRRPRETSAEILDAFNLMLEVEEQHIVENPPSRPNPTRSKEGSVRSQELPTKPSVLRIKGGAAPRPYRREPRRLGPDKESDSNYPYYHDGSHAACHCIIS